MAISKPIKTPYGSATYHVVSAVDVTRIPSLVSNITLSGYGDAAQRKDPDCMAMTQASFRHGVDGGLDLSKGDLVAQAYEFIKAQPGWADASDV